MLAKRGKAEKEVVIAIKKEPGIEHQDAFASASSEIGADLDLTGSQTEKISMGGPVLFIVTKKMENAGRKKAGQVVLGGVVKVGQKEGKVLSRCYAACWGFSNPSSNYDRHLPRVRCLGGKTRHTRS